MDTAGLAPKNDKFIKMTTEPVEKLVLSMAGPSITIMMITAFYNLTATYFVSSLGTSIVVFSRQGLFLSPAFFFWDRFWVCWAFSLPHRRQILAVLLSVSPF
jgi:hypothetical protein